MRCPCCGQLFDEVRPKLSLEFNTFFAGDRCVQLPPTPAEIVYAILQVAPAPMPRTRLIQKVFSITHRGRDQDQIIRSQVYIARRKLETIGYTIKHESDRGYRVVRLPNNLPPGRLL